MDKNSVVCGFLLLVLCVSGCGNTMPTVDMATCPDGSAEVVIVADGSVVHNNTTFLDRVRRKDDQLVLVDFWASWCGPCRMISPEIDAVKKQWGDELEVIKVDVDRNQEIAQFFQVDGIPLLLIFRSGKPIHAISGVHSANEISGQLQALL